MYVLLKIIVGIKVSGTSQRGIFQKAISHEHIFRKAIYQGATLRGAIYRGVILLSQFTEPFGQVPNILIICFDEINCF